MVGKQYMVDHVSTPAVGEYVMKHNCKISYTRVRDLKLHEGSLIRLLCSCFMLRTWRLP